MSKLWKINDSEWWIAPTLIDAAQAAMKMTGLPFDEVIDNPREATPEEMDRLVFVDADESRRSFREQLERRLTLGATTEFFASTDY